MQSLDRSKDSLDNFIAVYNAALTRLGKAYFLTKPDFQISELTEIISDDDVNTSVILTATVDGNFKESYRFFYRRLPVGRLFGQVRAIVPEGATSETILNQLAIKVNIFKADLDVNFNPLNRNLENQCSGTLLAKPDSLVYVGSTPITLTFA